MLELDKVTHEQFAACLSQDFELITGTGGIALQLVEVTTHGTGHPARREPFSLTFRGTPGLRLPQQIYALQNMTLGPMELFLVQLRDDATGSYFEAVFN